MCCRLDLMLLFACTLSQPVVLSFFLSAPAKHPLGRAFQSQSPGLRLSLSQRKSATLHLVSTALFTLIYDYNTVTLHGVARPTW